MRNKVRFSTCLFSLFAVFAHAEEPVSPSAPLTELVKSSKPNVTTSSHSIELNGATLSYNAETGYLPLLEEGKEIAQIFFTAYFAHDKAPDNKRRPITFCFNGGPGASSIWLHMGALGPKRVITEDVTMNASPGTYETNPYTLLTTSDLVFVDPVSTGFSKTATGIESKQFYGFDEDINSMTEFVRSFITTYKRWDSPKYLLGESYGTVRIVGLADKLAEQHYLQVNGLCLLSSCINLQTAELYDSNDLASFLALPSYAATAWYHKKLDPSELQKTLPDFLHEVEDFAILKYATALFRGDSIADHQKEEVARALSRYTGINQEQYLSNSLRLSQAVFRKKLLEHEEKTIGRFDSRFQGFIMDPESAVPIFDPSFDAITGSFVSAFQSYLQNELHFTENAPYYALNREVQPWNFGRKELPAGLGYLNVTEHLKANMIQNPNLRVYVASSYYDLATPYFATAYTLNHLFLPQPLRKQVHHSFFEAGHLMYLHKPSLVKLSTELKEFMTSNNS